MPFSSWPLEFHQDVAGAIDRIRRHLSPAHLPPALYHYTSFSACLGIIDSRALWATSVEDLEDQSEICHGIDMVRVEIQQQQEQCLAEFPRRLLSALSEALSTRRAWTFVACFRPNRVQKERGLYCLQFDTLSNWEPRLRLSGLHADAQYRRVIYRRSRKREAIHRAIDSIMIAAARNGRGDLQGPWAESIVRIHASIAAQSLMGIIASFKCCAFEWEDEWRIVCGPTNSAAASAPDLGDDAFKLLIKGEPKRHVELRLPEQHSTVVAFPKSEVPFSRICVGSDSTGRDAERQRIREALHDSGRSDIELR